LTPVSLGVVSADSKSKIDLMNYKNKEEVMFQRFQEKWKVFVGTVTKSREKKRDIIYV
jgi:hypothetical protein